MIDPDARMWCTDGTEMTVVEIGHCFGDDKRLIRRRKLTMWLDEHTQGEYVITPWLIGFEFGVEATLFQLGFDHVINTNI